jgi:hypothetical protein
MAMMKGTSLLVPSVQELAKQPITEIPDRYVHPNQDPIVASNTITNSLPPQVPVIDLSKLLADDATELENLDLACRDWGFFQVYFAYFLHLFKFKLKHVRFTYYHVIIFIKIICKA